MDHTSEKAIQTMHQKCMAIEEMLAKSAALAEKLIGPMPIAKADGVDLKEPAGSLESLSMRLSAIQHNAEDLFRQLEHMNEIV